VLSALAPVATYYSRRPEQTPVYRVLLSHWETFARLWQEQTGGHALPAFVTKTVEAYLRCGIAAYGLVRARCTSCGADRFVAFSCKKRGLCPSCTGRMMSERAWQISDEMLGNVPVRQWVLSLPPRVRALCAWDAPLRHSVGTIFARAVLADYRRRAQRCGIGGQSGSVTVLQRFSQTLSLHIHYHLVAIDGVYDPSGDFHRIDAPSPDDIETVATRIHYRVTRYLRKRGLEDGASDYQTGSDEFTERDPALAAITQASLSGTLATGRRAGMTVMRMGMVDVPQERPAPERARLSADISGYNLHAGVFVSAMDAQGRERLLRYLLRGPLSLDRLREIDGGRIALTLRKPLRDGTTHLVFEPLEFIEKLIALIPFPRAHQLRYHGVLGPAAKLRPQIVKPRADPSPAETETAHDETPASRARRKRWAQLLAHVFQIDILCCPKCQGRMKIIAAITRPQGLLPILEFLGLPTSPPTPAPARAPPQGDLFARHAPTLSAAEHTDPDFPDPADPA
jgi:hypothetical protein